MHDVVNIHLLGAPRIKMEIQQLIHALAYMFCRGMVNARSFGESTKEASQMLEEEQSRAVLITLYMLL